MKVGATNEERFSKRSVEGGEGTAKVARCNVKTPHAHDVLCGRGGGTNNHPGNEHFRDQVNARKVAYLHSSKRKKPLVSRSIVDTIRSMDPPGRFLLKDEASGTWHDIGDQKAREKTSQALREGAPVIRREISVGPTPPKEISVSGMTSSAALVHGLSGQNVNVDQHPGLTTSSASGGESSRLPPGRSQSNDSRYLLQMQQDRAAQMIRQQQVRQSSAPSRTQQGHQQIMGARQQPFPHAPMDLHQRAVSAAMSGLLSSGSPIQHARLSGFGGGGGGMAGPTNPAVAQWLAQGAARNQQHRESILSRNANPFEVDSSNALGQSNLHQQQQQSSRSYLRNLTGPSGLGQHNLHSSYSSRSESALLARALMYGNLGSGGSLLPLAQDIKQRLLLAEWASQKVSEQASMEEVKKVDKAAALYREAGLLGMDPDQISQQLANGHDLSSIVLSHYSQINGLKNTSTDRNTLILPRKFTNIDAPGVESEGTEEHETSNNLEETHKIDSEEVKDTTRALNEKNVDGKFDDVEESSHKERGGGTKRKLAISDDVGTFDAENSTSALGKRIRAALQAINAL
jgi:hypothetical protein